MPDLLVVGGTGFLGRRLVAAAQRADVVATHHTTPPVAAGPRWLPLDLTDGGSEAAELIERLRPASVVNAAYVPGGDHLRPITAAAPGAMAAACAAIGARFVHLSSDVVFDGTTDRPYTEDDPTRPVHAYGRAKVLAEEQVAAADPSAVIVRTSLLWGDTQDPGPQALMVMDPAMTFYDDEYRNPLEVDLLAAACLELTTRRDITGVLHVAGDDTVDRHEFARLLAPLVGVDPSTVRGAPGLRRDDRPRNSPLDSSRGRHLLTTRLRGVRAALG